MSHLQNYQSLWRQFESMEIFQIRRSVPPDSEQRRRAKVLILAASILGVFAIRIAYDYTDHLKALAGLDIETSLAGMQRFALILLCANAIVSSILAIYFLWLAWQVWKGGQFPPRNVKLIRTTRIYTGAGAKAIALLCLVIALLLLSTNIFMWRFQQMLVEMSKRQSTLMLNQPYTPDSFGAQLASEQDRLGFGGLNQAIPARAHASD